MLRFLLAFLGLPISLCWIQNGSQDPHSSIDNFFTLSCVVRSPPPIHDYMDTMNMVYQLQIIFESVECGK